MNRPWLIIIIALLLAPLGVAQTAPISGQIISQYGQPVPGAQVYICNAATSTGLPCSPVASIFSDYNLTQPTANPTIADANGNFNVYVGALAFPNIYVVNAIANTGGTPYTWLYPGPSGGGGLATGCSSTPVGNLTCSGSITANAVYAKITGVPNPDYDVDQNGARGYPNQTTGSISASSNLLTLASMPTPGYIVGQGINVAGAVNATTPLVTTITGISGLILTLAASATTGVSGAVVATDDTAAVQAAWNACYNGGVDPYGGWVLFNGLKSYVVSSTINTYDSCQAVATTSGDGVNLGAPEPVPILWNGPPVNQQNVVSFTSFTIAANSGALKPVSSPVHAPTELVTVTGTNSYSVGNWVLLNNCSSAGGWQINRLVGQVVSASGSSFAIAVPNTFGSTGSFTDTTCTAQQENVAMATDSTPAREHMENLLIAQMTRSPSGAATGIGVAVLIDGRLDSGSDLKDVWIDGNGCQFGVYLGNGALDMAYDTESRFDTLCTIAGLYMRGGNSDINILSNSMTTNNSGSPNPINGGGANIMVDNAACLNSGASTRIKSDMVTYEADGNFLPGFGAIMVKHCPTDEAYTELEFTGTGGGLFSNGNTAGANNPMFVVSPPSDTALAVDLMNFAIGGGAAANKTPYFVGTPAMLRSFIAAPNETEGFISHFTYVPALYSLGLGATNSGQAMTQVLSDFNFGQCYEFGIPCSTYLYSDTAFAALPNGTTLVPGQVLAPPANWAATGSNLRYPLDSVKTAGTTGTPGYGITSCTNGNVATLNVTCTSETVAITATACTSGVETVTTATQTTPFQAGWQIIMQGTAETILNGVSGEGVPVILTGATTTSFTYDTYCPTSTSNPSDTGTATVSMTHDLGIGQYVTLPGLISSTQIRTINSQNPQSVLLSLSNSTTASASPATLAYVAPVLNNEIQLLTKSAAAPTTGTWTQGDYVENSGATSQGIAGWLCVASGTPGTWAAVPSANASGQIAASQVTGLIQSTFKLTGPFANTGTTGVGGVTGISGGSGFSGTGTLLLSAFNNSCSGSTVTVNITSGVFTSATVTAAGSGCTAAPTSATCTSGTATCTGSPVSITVAGSLVPTQVASLTIPAGTLSSTGQLGIQIDGDACSTAVSFPTSACTGSANTGKCQITTYFGTANTGGTLVFNGPPSAPGDTARLFGALMNTSASTQLSTLASFYSGSSSAASGSQPSTINTANTSYLNFYLTNTVSADNCFIDGVRVQVY